MKRNLKNILRQICFLLFLFSIEVNAFQFPFSFWHVTAHNPALVRYLIVAGGGGGGADIGAGGGAGGVLDNGTVSHSVTVGSYAITVGNGGSGVTTNGGSPQGPDPTHNGSNSIFDGIISYGGGVGGSFFNNGCNDGSGNCLSILTGSGGGDSANLTAGGVGVVGQGHDGGRGSGNLGADTTSGGGGGAGVIGTDGLSDQGGNGGNGIQSNITAVSLYYGGGGGGGAHSAVATLPGVGGLGGGGNGGSTFALSAGGAGTNGVGGGGGGGGVGFNGGTGGNGVVVIAYLTGSLTATGGTISVSAPFTIHVFLSSGTFQVTSIP